MKTLKNIALAVPVAVLSSSVFAEVDVTAATTTLSTDGSAAISSVGGALIGLAALAVVFKWVKGAIFG